MNELLAHGLGRFIVANAVVGIIGLGMLVELEEPALPLMILVALTYGVLLVVQILAALGRGGRVTR